MCEKNNEKDRYNKLGKCCWTCCDSTCIFHRFNNPPEESTEGRSCQSYVMPKIEEESINGTL